MSVLPRTAMRVRPPAATVPSPAVLGAATLLALAGCNDSPADPSPQPDAPAFLESGVLTVLGDDGPNDIRLTYSGSGVRVARDGGVADFTEPVGAIDITVGAGNDVVRLDQTVVADLDLSVAAGDGDDEVLLSFDPAGAGSDIALALDVEVGTGSDRLDFRWDGTAVPALSSFVTLSTRGTALTPEQGNEVLVAFEHGDAARPYVIGSVWNGKGSRNAPPGGDSRSMDLELDFTGGHADLALRISGGAGPDALDLNVDYSNAAPEASRISLEADLGEGDNHVGKYVITSARHTYVDTEISAGHGNNVLDLEDVLSGDGEQTYTVELGDGDNQTTIRFGDGERGRRPTSGTRNVTASYRSGAGRNAVAIHSDVVEPLSSRVTIDYGAGQGTTTGRYKLRFPWDRASDAHASGQVVPSQVKVVLLAPSESALDLQVDVGDPDVDDPSAFGRVAVQSAAVRQADLDFVHQRVIPAGAADAEEEWTLRLRDGRVAGDGSLVIDAPPGLERLVYLQDTLEVEAGATMKVALHADALDDALLAHLLGVTAAGRYEFLADGGPGHDLLAVLSRDLVAEGGGQMTFDASGADGNDVLGLLPPAGLGRQGPILHAMAGGTGTDACFTLQDVPATDCDRREIIGEELLKLLETVFGAELVEVWRE